MPLTQVPPVAIGGLVYGTAGFRGNAEDGRLDGVAYRCGVIAALRALSERGRLGTVEPEKRQAGQVWAIVGVMVTASHNPSCDNGFKIVDCDGGMLERRWEQYAVDLVTRGHRAEDIGRQLQHIAGVEQISSTVIVNARGTAVLIGQDTRTTSPSLARWIHRGAAAAAEYLCRDEGGVGRPSASSLQVVDVGVCSTPALHYAVWRMQRETWRPSSQALDAAERVLSEYEERLVAAFVQATASSPAAGDAASARTTMVVDCANGAGAPLLQRLCERLPPACPYRFVLVNTAVGDADHLNERCGADYVQRNRQAPAVWDSPLARSPPECAGSLDGDADRLVCFFHPTPNALCLLDGDHMVALLVDFVVGALLHASDDDGGETVANRPEGRRPWRVGVALTAYSNAACVAFLHRLRKSCEVQQQTRVPNVSLDIVFAETGVKHLERQAREYDIGIYFEPNGHGTVLWPCLNTSPPATQRHLPAALQLLARLANPAIGDGVANLLLLLAVLHARQWSLAMWHDALFTPLPAVHRTVRVPDRHLIVTRGAHYELLQPEALRDSVNQLVQAVSAAPPIEPHHPADAATPAPRVLIRPSGTEDIVRIYVEASPKPLAEQLAADVEDAVIRILHPSMP
ncbi:hypothetical protein CDCA_CDCA08G2394 [Cyanidium caldarium]|uniref:Phosphoacetylglucosamine mutase n=1 Tax=Cyanidium caldarium TaxID=2771 RepID=A0AAV9IVQ7_CYACA|nr:hypothetical protein CDCA_CDCA08G2394 [Cyanidium caldarium]